MEHQEDQPSNPGRRRLLKGVVSAAVLASAGYLGLKGDPNTSQQESAPRAFSSPEQIEKKMETMRELADFMATYTKSTVVADFLASNPSVSQVDDVFRTTTMQERHTKEKLQAWSFVKGDSEVVFARREDNLRMTLPDGFKEISVYLQKDGRLGRSELEGLSPRLTPDEEKQALQAFVAPLFFSSPQEQWDIYRGEKKEMVARKTHKTDTVMAEALIGETGRAHVGVTKLAPHVF